DRLPVAAVASLEEIEDLGPYLVAVGQHDRALDRVAELAHVPRPRVVLEERRGARREAALGASELEAVRRDEVRRERQDLVGALAQRGNADHRAEAIEQV